jgi:hypothetical protein
MTMHGGMGGSVVLGRKVGKRTRIRFTKILELLDFQPERFSSSHLQ